MRQLITDYQENLIECDNTNCDYVIKNEDPYDHSYSLGEEYINTPCPLCGDNLLTQKDFDDNNKLTKIIEFINKWFSWITIFYKKSEKRIKIGEYKVHNGIKKLK